MWVLGNYSYLKLVKKLKQFGFVFYREGKWSHQLWKYKSKIITIPKHKEVKAGTIKAILNEAWISLKDFLEK
jgi:predicted RNA binding protein YcfA (HicA-like mRNA interferase family)